MSALSLIVAVGATVAAGFTVVHHALGHIRHINVAYLDPVGGPSGAGETVLLTSNNDGGPGWASGSAAAQPTGLVMLLHVNANQQGGGVVSLRPTTIVPVPGHGRQPDASALRLGGPSLLVLTVKQVTHTRINHFARIDFAGVSGLTDAIGGVNVATPSGTIHLTGPAAISYARDPALTEYQRVLRQQTLIRAILHKIANENLLTNPVTMVGVLNALTAMLTVDSNFTTGQIASLAKDLGGMSGQGSPFVTAPVRTVGGQQVFSPAADLLWTAITQDAIAAFARMHPGTVTPAVVQ